LTSSSHEKLAIDWKVFQFLDLHRTYPRYFGREKSIVYSREHLLSLVRRNLGRKKLVVSVNYYLRQRDGELDDLVIDRVVLFSPEVRVHGYIFETRGRKFLVTKQLRGLPSDVEASAEIMVPFPLHGAYLKSVPHDSIDERKAENLDI